jgi:transcriptional regulator with XRE-family HTH domain
MQIQSELIRRLRTQRHWSQEQLAVASGLNLRTIQRLEAGGRASLESLRALAAVFEVDAATLTADDEDPANVTPIERVRDGFVRFGDFDGRADRADYWWLFSFVMLALAIATVAHPGLAIIVGLICLLPLCSAGIRRLRDAGHSGWWQLMFLVPFGFVVPLSLMMLPSVARPSEREAAAG